jgi:hypothetical protein
MNLKTLTLNDAQLNYATAIALNLDVELKLTEFNSGLTNSPGGKYQSYIPFVHGIRYQPTSVWSECAPIITQHLIGFTPYWSFSLDSRREAWQARKLRDIVTDECDYVFYGDTPLEAVLRCFVFLTLGEYVDIPPELV